MSCLRPIDSALLTDYWLAALPRPEEEAIEEHLFGCNECGDRLREVIALAEAIRTLARQGSLLMVVSDTFLDRVAEQGMRVRRNRRRRLPDRTPGRRPERRQAGRSLYLR